MKRRAELIICSGVYNYLKAHHAGVDLQVFRKELIRGMSRLTPINTVQHEILARKISRFFTAIKPASPEKIRSACCEILGTGRLHDALSTIIDQLDPGGNHWTGGEILKQWEALWD